MGIEFEDADFVITVPEACDDRINIPMKKSFKSEIDKRVDIILIKIPRMTRAELFRQILDVGTKNVLKKY